MCEKHKSGHCDTKSINADYLESVVLDIVSPRANQIISKGDFIRIVNNEKNVNKPLISRIEKDMNVSNRQIDAYYTALDKTENECIINATLERLEKEVNTHKKLKEKLESLKGKNELLNSLKLEDVKFNKESLLKNREVARTLCRLLIDKILVNQEEDTIEIILK